MGKMSPEINSKKGKVLMNKESGNLTYLYIVIMFNCGDYNIGVKL